VRATDGSAQRPSRCNYVEIDTRGWTWFIFFADVVHDSGSAGSDEELNSAYNALVRSVIVDETGMAKGVCVTSTGRQARNESLRKGLVLAASCVENRRHTCQLEIGQLADAALPNSSGQLAANLRTPYGCPGSVNCNSCSGQPAAAGDKIADSHVAWMRRDGKLEKSSRGKICSRLFDCNGRRHAETLRATTISLKARVRIQTRQQALLSDSVRRLDFRLRLCQVKTNYVSNRSREERLFSPNSQLRFHFQWTAKNY